MKGPIFPFPKAGPPAVWLFLHGGIILALVLSTVLGLSPPALDTDLLGLLPQSAATYAAADKLLGQRTSRNFLVLTESADFYRAKEGAERLYRALEQKTGPGPGDPFTELTFFVDETVLDSFAAYLHQYRYVLLDPSGAALLKNGGAGELAAEALAQAYGAFTFGGLDTLDSDPFLLAERERRYFLESALLSGGGVSLREGVLSGEFNGKHYVLLRGMLSDAGASINNAQSGVREIYRICGELTGENSAAGEAAPGGVSFIFSGFPFHSYESSSGAQREITLISFLTVGILLLLFLRIFRSPLPALVIIGAALVSIVLGLAAVFLVFRTIHILTFVFGVSLIGLSVDYSIHYFIHRRRGLDGGEIRRILLPGISLSFGSSLVCFLIFLFAPFGILRQFALFSAAGLLSSFVTVLCLFPGLPRVISFIPAIPRPLKKEGTKKPVLAFFSSPLFKTALPMALALASLGIILRRGQALTVENDIRNLYSVPAQLLESERIAGSVLNYPAGGAYFLIGGTDPQETLEHEEVFLARLRELTGKTFLGTSRFVPSIKTQEENYRASAELLKLGREQYRALGLPEENAEALEEQYRALAGHYALPWTVPAYLARGISNLFIGQAGENWYSVIMPLGEVDPAAASALAGEYPWAAFVRKTADISADLDMLTVTMLKLLGAAYALIVLGICIYYRRGGKILRIVPVPILLALVSLGIHGLFKVHLSFFSVAGFILVLGLGLDYMFYLTENKDISGQSTSKQGVVLSYVTTAVSFGALLFSSFIPVRLLSLAVFPGLSAAFICAMVLKDQR
ncbi:MAG: MMPL family transporter [Spirochaetaceae bacterium]|jgi:predicted exporter|nr:MMPL family transporter [Spirochaetaceae bacterium]